MSDSGIDILHCGHGHSEIRFTDGNPLELERARRIIVDMLKRGYVLFIEEADKKLTRIDSFDPERLVYIIADGPLYAGDGPIETEQIPLSPKKGKHSKREIQMSTVKVTAIPRTAGG